MKKFLPLKGWHYNPLKISDFNLVVAPPYDVIGSEQLKELHEKSPYNVVWIDVPEAKKSGEEIYQQAAGRYQAWKQEKILVQEEKSAIYLYFQSYQLPDGRPVTRKGFFVRRLATPFGSRKGKGEVLPHEKTFAGPKEDRFKLTQATQANLSPVFGLYADSKMQMAPLLEKFSQGKPLFDFKDSDNQRHQIWKVDQEEEIAALLTPLEEQNILIADGHHRYETAVRYAQWRRESLEATLNFEKTPQNSDYVLMYCCALQDPGLVILPTHRILAKRPQISPENFRQALKAYAEIHAYPLAEAKAVEAKMKIIGENQRCLAWVHDDKIELITFISQKIATHPRFTQFSEALRSLDVTLLHNFVLAEAIGMPHEQQREYGHIHYVKSFTEALKLTQENKTYGFLMNPTQLSELEAVTQQGETMPQKSTFFYPKLPTGLLFSDLD